MQYDASTIDITRIDIAQLDGYSNFIITKDAVIYDYPTYRIATTIIPDTPDVHFYQQVTFLRIKS